MLGVDAGGAIGRRSSIGEVDREDRGKNGESRGDCFHGLKLRIGVLTL
jgi:hypothetical protein